MAEPSRLAFDVPVTEQIEYSSEGVLEAMSRLVLRVVPLATPRTVFRRLPPIVTGPLTTGPITTGPIARLPGGVLLSRGEQGLAFTRAAGRSRVATTAAELISQSATMKLARTLLAQESAVDLGRLTATSDNPHPITTVGGIGITRPIPIRPVRQHPRRPQPDETAIEAPWRLVISPSNQEGFAHANSPQPAPTDPDRIELWHSRLGVRDVAADGSVTIDERDGLQKIIRAVWARDEDGAQPVAGDLTTPFRTSLQGSDRTTLVTESSDASVASPQPVDAKRLYLSSQGAWLDLHGTWDTTPYSMQEPIDSWDHIATMGRDQYVKVSYPGYLFPFGHKASLIKITERRIDASGNPEGYLYQREFIVVREPVKSYGYLGMPLAEVRFRTLVTPHTRSHRRQNRCSGQPWVQSSSNSPSTPSTRPASGSPCTPHSSSSARRAATPRTSRRSSSLYTTPDSGTRPRAVPTDSQTVALASSGTPGDTSFETNSLSFTGIPGDPHALEFDPEPVQRQRGHPGDETPGATGRSGRREPGRHLPGQRLHRR